MFGKLGDMYSLQQKARKMKKTLKGIYIESEDKYFKVTVSADQKIVDIEVLDTTILNDSKKASKILVDLINKALDKSQKVAAEQMKDIMGDMNFPGM